MSAKNDYEFEQGWRLRLMKELNEETAKYREIVQAARIALEELGDMADTAGDDSRFNEGGSVYECIDRLRTALAKLPKEAT